MRKRGAMCRNSLTLEVLLNPKGPSTQYLGTWDLGNSNYSTGFGALNPKP